MTIKHFHHVALSTGDMDKVFAFYVDLLDLEVTMDVDLDTREAEQRNFPESEFHPTAEWMGRMHTRIVNMRVPGGTANIEVFQYKTPCGKDVEGQQLRQYDHRISHFGFQVDDIDAMTDKLKAAGVEFHWYPAADVGNGTRATYVYDFEGNTVEFISNPELSGLQLG
jgi:catechol 2,3-dioxygenase-like lactoylglutathione lyase family enzyme